MQSVISIRVALDEKGIPSLCVVVNAVLDDGGKVMEKHALTKGGEWLMIAEGAIYPDEVRLPVLIKYGNGNQ